MLPVPLALPRFVVAPLLQVAVEYGGSVSGSVRSDARNAASELLSQWNAVIPVPPWVAGVAALALWLSTRGRRGSSSGSGGVGNVVLLILALAILFVLARAAGVV